jgi:hypothetical protein
MRRLKSFTHNKYKAILVLALMVLTVILVVSACNIIGVGEEPPPGPSTSAILAPPDKARVLVGSPVQIQSAHTGSNISRVELWVKVEGEETEKLLQADVPSKGVVLQQWIPDQAGVFTIKVIAYNQRNEARDPLTIQVEAIATTAISLTPVPSEPEPGEPAQREPSDEGVAFEAPAATPLVEVFIAATTPTPTPIPPTPTLVPTPTPTPFYPPPPPAPGVPPGPTQDQLPELRPPVCDAADLVGVYTANTSQRVTITEPDDVAAKTVGGATVFRAWRLQNTGTCTWGPGYELAFYGGRSMGSGGVAFESTFPGDPGRRNIIVDRNRLVVPEGLPNQVAVVEVLLNAPVTPGIHQSYWRMRNPQGVYFGPIMGVTLEVVRECQFGIYGAPVINRFEILGVGDVFRPENPISVQAQFGQTVTLDWDIINVTNIDIVLESPTGKVSTISSGDPTDRASFRPTELGLYTITLYADNGPCTVSAQVVVDVVPPDDETFFVLDVNASAASTADIDVRWRHLDRNVDKIDLIAQLYQRSWGEQCTFGWTTLDTVGLCDDGWGEWSPVSGQRLRSEIIAVRGEDLPPEITSSSETTPRLASEQSVQVGDTTVAQGSASVAVTTIGASAQGLATISNIEWGLCPNPGSYNPAKQQYGIQYYARAEREGSAASPEFSNTVDTICGGGGTIPGEGPGELPTEIQGTFNP